MNMKYSVGSYSQLIKNPEQAHYSGSLFHYLSLSFIIIISMI